MEKDFNTCTVLSQWIAGFDLDAWGEKAEIEARLRLLDYVISSIAGLKVNAAYNHIAEKVIYSFGGYEQSSVLFCQQKLPAPEAAYLNATYGHGADLDDGHKTANGHPGVALIPAVLALAEQQGSTAKAIWESIVVGYEVYIRVSNAIQPSALHRGFHGTGVVGAVAAAAACAKLLALPEKQVFNAISFAAIQASGLFEISESGQMTKPVNPANACRTGIMSALFAREGIDAPANPFEGVKGFYKAFSGEPRQEEITRGLGQELLIGTAYIKLYPACRHLHPSVDAGSELRKKINGQLERIEKITIYTYPNAILVTGKIFKPASPDEAKFSMKYALAKALQNGTYTLEDLNAQIGLDDVTEKLIDKTEIIPDDAYEVKEKKIRGCKVVLLLTGGESVEQFIPVPRGDPEFPLTQEAIQGKVAACCNGLYTQEEQAELYDCILSDGDFSLPRLYRALHHASSGLNG